SDGLGKGSSFSIRLPCVRGPESHPGVATPPQRSARPRRILVVEDNEDAREMLRVALSLAGHTVYEAKDGPEGVEMATTVAADVALIDVGLPGLDGYDVARRIRADRVGRSMLLVAITGYGQVEDRQRALDAGFDAHLTKPILPAQLVTLLEDS